MSVAVNLTSLFAADDKDSFSGFKKGFFGSEKPKNTKSKSTVIIEASLPEREHKSSGEFASIWLDPAYRNADAINYIFQRMNFVCPPAAGQEKMYPWFKKRQVPAEILTVQENFKLLYFALSTEDPVEIEKIARTWRCENSESAVRKTALMNIDLLGSYFLIKALSNEKKRNENYSQWCPTESAAFYADALQGYDIAPDQRYIDHKEPMIAMQIVDNLLLFSIFKYTNPSEDDFLTSGSDAEQGQVIVNARFWPMDLPKPKLFYYQENIDDLLLYRMYFAPASVDERAVYDGVRYLPETSDFKGYQLTQIHAQAERINVNNLRAGYDIFTAHSGYILNKDATLFQNKGVAILLRNESFEIFSYGLHSIIGQHCFSSMPYRHTIETFHQSPYLEALVTIGGGIHELARRKLVFVPDASTRTTMHSEIHQEPTYNESKFLLPYLYKLKNEGDNSERLTKAILRIENILVEAEYEEKSAAVMDEIEHAIVDQIEKEIEDGKPEIIAAIDAKATQLYTAYRRPKPGKKNWGVDSRKARDDAKQQLKEEKKSAKLLALSEEEKTRLKKEKIIEKIRKSFVEKTADRRHFDSSEVVDILASMRRTFARAEIATTGIRVTHGSHAGLEMKTADGSVKLGLAKRPQADGYEAGTVRTIINDHVDRILSLVINS